MSQTPPAEPFEPTTELTHPNLLVATVSPTPQRLSEATVQQRIGAERAQLLPKRIDELYDQIARGVISDNTIVGEALLFLRKARDKDLEDPREFDEAEYLVNVAQYKVTHSKQVRRWTYLYGLPVLGYGLIWLAIFGAGLIFENLLARWLTLNGATVTAITRMNDLFPAYTVVLAGGIGGILSLMYSLYKHAAKDGDFDRQFVIWYILQPFMGVIMGLIVYLFLVAGVFSIINAEGPTFETIGALVAIAAAFRPHYIYGWLEWLLQAIRPGGREAKPAATGVTKPVEAAAASVKEEAPVSVSEPAGVG